MFFKHIVKHNRKAIKLPSEGESGRKEKNEI